MTASELVELLIGLPPPSDKGRQRVLCISRADGGSVRWPVTSVEYDSTMPDYIFLHVDLTEPEIIPDAKVQTDN